MPTMAGIMHFGGPGRHLDDPVAHGIGIMRSVLSHWRSLDITQVGSVIAIASTVPRAWSLLHQALHHVGCWVSQFFLASVTVPADDLANRSVLAWLSAHRPRYSRTFTGRTEARAADGAAGPGSVIKKTRRDMEYTPHWTSRWFLYGANLFVVSHKAGSSPLSRPYSQGGEDMTISCLGLSADPIKALIDECREFAETQTQFFVIIYARDRYGTRWQPKLRKPIRRLDTVHFDDGDKQDLIADIRQYLEPSTQRLYQSRSMPYRRGYLFYGPPGSGKTSLTTALAGEFGLDLYEIKIPSVQSDADLEQMFLEIPPQSIVLLEDIDAVWARRTAENPEGRRDGQHAAPQTSCTLSGLLNVLDGVGSQEGRVVVMTTNKPDRLDGALVRPGRVDKRVFLGNISRRSAEQMFERMFAPELAPTPDAAQPDKAAVRAWARQFARHIPENALTPSHLQGFFQLHLDSPERAASSIEAWVARELPQHTEKDFEVVSSHPRDSEPSESDTAGPSPTPPPAKTPQP